LANSCRVIPLYFLDLRPWNPCSYLVQFATPKITLRSKARKKNSIWDSGLKGLHAAARAAPPVAAAAWQFPWAVSSAALLGRPLHLRRTGCFAADDGGLLSL